MGKRAAVITTAPKPTREGRIRRATKDDLRGQGIDGAIESYLATTDQAPPTTKR